MILSPDFQHLVNDMVHSVLIEVGFDIDPGRTTDTYTLKASGDNGEGHIIPVTVGDFVRKQASNNAQHKIKENANYVHISTWGQFEGNPSHKEWADRINAVWKHSILSKSTQTSPIDVDIALNEMRDDVEKYATEIARNGYTPTALNGTTELEKRMMFNREILPFFLSQEAPELAAAALPHDVMPNSILFSAVRTSKITASDIEEFSTYPHSWLQTILGK